MRRRLAFLASLLWLALFVGAQELGADRDRFFEMAKKFELKFQATPPTGFLHQEEPFFQFAWLSDMHIENQTIRQETQKLLEQIRQEIHPLAVLITGDSWGIGAKPLSRQKDFQAFLREALQATPIIVLPGDNWPEAFQEVFGTDTYAFTLGGFRFICASVDASGRRNGCSVFEQDTRDWLRTQFSQAGKHPVIYIQHEPVEPPMTLDAPDIAAMLDATPSTLLALGGHLHLNLAFRRRHWRQWVAPSTGRSHCPVFKVLSFYADAVTAQDWEKSTENGKYLPVKKYLVAQIPEEFRKNLHAVSKFQMEDYQPMPARARKMDPTLDARVQEVNHLLMQYALRFAMTQLF